MINELSDLEQEIALIKQSEQKMDYVFLVTEIINAFNSVKTIVNNLPPQMKLKLSEEGHHLLDGFYMQPTGFVLDGINLKIKKNKYLIITLGGKTIFEFSDKNIIGKQNKLKKIVERARLLTDKFQKKIRKEFQRIEKETLEELKNF